MSTSHSMSFADLLGRDFSFFESENSTQSHQGALGHEALASNGLYSLGDNKQLAHVLNIDNPVLFPSPPSTPMMQAGMPSRPSIYHLASIATSEPRLFDSQPISNTMPSLSLDFSSSFDISRHSLPRPTSSIHVPTRRPFDTFSLTHSPSSNDLYLPMSNSFPKSNYSHLQTMDRKGSSNSLYIGKTNYACESTRYLSSTLDALEQNDVTKSPKLFKCPRVLCSKVYKNANGLKYHLEHGKCEIDSTSEEASLIPDSVLCSSGSIKNFDGNEEIMIARRPYFCRVPGCHRKYKNLNGLKYHARVTHPELDFQTAVKGHYNSPLPEYQL